jgi:hypothetical protein
MAFGSQGAIFLGEDLMHSRDYSEDTSRVVDEEVKRILTEQEARATHVLQDHMEGLKAVTAALLAKESIDGEEVARLIKEAYGKPVHDIDEDDRHFARGIAELQFETPVTAGAGSASESQSTGMATGSLNPTDPLDPLA